MSVISAWRKWCYLYDFDHRGLKIFAKASCPHDRFEGLEQLEAEELQVKISRKVRRRIGGALPKCIVPQACHNDESYTNLDIKKGISVDSYYTCKRQRVASIVISS